MRGTGRLVGPLLLGVLLVAGIRLAADQPALPDAPSPSAHRRPKLSVDEWTQVNGPHGGWITDMEKSGADLLAATSFTNGLGGNGLYRVGDAGRTWVSLGGTRARMLDVAIDPTDPRDIAFAADGLHLSRDGGESWERAGIDAEEVTAVAMSAADPSLVLAGGRRGGTAGLWVSEDDGLSWTGPWALPDSSWSVKPIWAGFTDETRNEIRVIEPHPTDRNLVFVGTNSALQRTSDLGRTWRRVDTAFHRTDVMDLAIDARTPDKIFARVGLFEERTCMEVAGMEDRARASRIERERCAGVYASTDRGKTWRQLDASYFDPSEGGIFIDDHDPRIAYAIFSRKILRTQDGGQTWKPFFWTHDQSLIANSGIEALATGRSSDEVFIAGRQGLWRTGDGGAHWEERNEGFIGSEVVDIVRAGDGTLYAGTYSMGMFRSTDGGRSWTFASYRLENPYVMLIAVHPREPQTVFVTTNGGVYMSRDGALTWRRPAAGFFGHSELLPGIAHFHGIAFDPRDSDRIYVGGGGDQWSPKGAGISMTSDGGRSWRHANVGFQTDVHVSKIVVDSRTGVVYATTQGPTNFNEKSGSGAGVFRSRDHGRTWEQINAGLGTVETNTIALDPRARGVLYLGTDDDGLYKSTDGGSSWRPLPVPGLPARYGVGDVVVDPRNGDVFVATVDYFRLAQSRGLVGDHGVWASRDGGSSWGPFNTGLEHAGAFSLEFDARRGVLFVGTRGGGVYWRALPAR